MPKEKAPVVGPLPTPVNLAGMQFTDLQALYRVERPVSAPRSRDVYWLCRCKCGTEKAVSRSALLRGSTRTCGCSRRVMREAGACANQHPAYSTWRKMKRRCLVPEDPAWKHYGARGITICVAWLDDFWQFAKDMGPKPSRAHSIDRIDNDGNYEPGNCRWATRAEQDRNRSDNRVVVFRGQKMIAADAMALVGIKTRQERKTFYARLCRGWQPDLALTAPVEPHTSGRSKRYG